MAEQERSVVGYINKHQIQLALSSDARAVCKETIVAYGNKEQPTISGAIITFAQAHGLPPTFDLTLAVAGVVEAERITVTSSPWFGSRDGLARMLGRAPIILNDFEALGWALAGSGGSVLTASGCADRFDVERELLLVGIGDELGVAAIRRDSEGRSFVVSSEAGAMILPYDAGKRLAELGLDEVQAYRMLRASGLDNMKAALSNRPATSSRSFERSAVAGSPSSNMLVDLYADVLASFCMNLTQVFGTWGGLVLTGSVANRLGDPLVAALQRIKQGAGGLHARRLRNLPICTATLAGMEMEGAVAAGRFLRRTPS